MGSIFKHHPSRDRTGAAAGRGHPSCTGPDWHRHPVPDPPRVSLSAVATTLTAPTRLRPPTRGPHRVPRTVSCVSHRSHDAMGRVASRGSRFGPGSKPLRRVTRRRWFRNKPNRGARGSGTQAPHRPLSKSLFLTIQSFTFHSSGSPSLRDRVAGVPTASGSVWSCRCGLQALMLQAMVCAASSSSARCSLQESNGTIAAQRGINVGEAQLVGTAHRRDLGLGL